MSKKGTVLHSRAREIVRAVDTFFDAEKNHANDILRRLNSASGTQTPDGDITTSQTDFKDLVDFLKSVVKATDRVAAATGVGRATVSRIRRESRDAEVSTSALRTPKKKPRCKNIVCDNFDLCALGNMINAFYVIHKEVPTLNKLFVKTRRDLQFPGSKSTLRRILVNQLGYTFKKCGTNRALLIQRPSIRAWRARYLRRLRQNDALGANKKPVVYLDETWIHSNYSVNKCWQSSRTAGLRKKEGAGTRFIIANAGTENGFIENGLLMFKANTKTGDYHDQINGENFMKWLTLQVIPNLPNNSLIIMDNAPYHTKESNRAPDMRNRKDEMQAWLTSKNIEYLPEMRKPELYKLIKRNKPTKNYIVDKLFKDNGHEVLRLPPYNCDLNAIEYIWHLIKRRVADKNVTQEAKEIEKLTHEAIQSITADDWRKEVNHVKRIERSYAERELMEDDDDGTYSFVINTGEDSDDEDDSTASSDDNNSDDDEISGFEVLPPD